MRKLVIFCFAVCMTVLTVLSLFNFAQDAEESMMQRTFRCWIS